MAKENSALPLQGWDHNRVEYFPAEKSIHQTGKISLFAGEVLQRVWLNPSFDFLTNEQRASIESMLQVVVNEILRGKIEYCKAENIYLEAVENICKLFELNLQKNTKLSEDERVKVVTLLAIEFADNFTRFESYVHEGDEIAPLLSKTQIPE